MAKRDFYDVLGVAKNASDDDIKKAYRRLAGKHHPDRHGQSEGANTDMAALNGAYEVLCDATTRAAYDASLDDPFSGIDPAAQARESRAARIGSSEVVSVSTATMPARRAATTQRSSAAVSCTSS